MYEYAGGSSSKVTSAIDNALGINAPLVIGEFGYKHRSGDVAWQTILDYTKTKSVGYMGWSWTGNGDGVEFLDMFSGYDDSNMLYNGQCILNGTNGIKATSKECSIYNTTGIETAENECADNVARTEYYSLSGQQLTQPVHGVNIVRMYLHNGRTVCKKIYMR
jgi:mannan endo-1,4-beta-mannosidase